MDVNEFVGFLDDVSGRLDAGNFREDLEKCVDPIQRGFDDNFKHSATAQGEAWPPRKDPRPKHPLLILSGALQRSVVGKGDGHLETIGNMMLELGTSLPYSRVHQFGYPEKNIAQRAYLDVHEAFLDECETILAAGLARIVKGE